MATPTTDPKVAPLADDLREFALTLDRTVFPKGFFCALCDQLAFDSYKLLCCNKAICSSCQDKLEFPTTCPSCDHSPVEAESCPPNKALRNTMRVWLQKQKKKDEAKAASQAATPVVDATPAPREVSPPTDSIEKTGDTVAAVPGAEEAGEDTIAPDAAPEEGQGSAPVQPEEGVAADRNQQEGEAPNDAGASVEKQTDGEDTSGATAENPMMNANGMPNQMGFGFNGQQGSFGMGMGMGPMNNMMNNGWNNMGYGMNNMNNMAGMNGMFGFGGMGMNDMSMNYGGGFGNGWNNMGNAGYGFNGYNQSVGYNQSGAYPEMMNQYPKNYMSNTNRFHGNGGSLSQQRSNRNGSFGAGNNRPRSQNGLQNRDGQSPAGTADPAPEKGNDEQTAASAEPEQGKTEAAEADATGEALQADAGAAAEDPTPAEAGVDESNRLNQIQTVDSIEMDDQGFDQTMMNGSMSMQYPPHMMNQFPNQMNGSFNPNMGFQQNNFGARGGFNHAYGAATVLTGEPRGVGVAGAPTGPRAMREGRPNTGFSSRANNARYNASVQPSAASVTERSRSPSRKARSRSPVRDESLRSKEKSRTRSRPSSRSRGADQAERRARSRSVNAEGQESRAQSPAQTGDDRRKDKSRHQSSRYDGDRAGRDEYDDRLRDDRESRGSRGDRTRSASIDSKYRSRRDKDKYRSSRSQRDRSRSRSREHRRRHRSRSHSPNAEGKDDYADAHDSSSRRKERSDKDKYREKDRDRSRDRDRERDRKDRKDREYDRNYDDDKYRSRDKDKDRRRRRDRETEEEYDDDRYRSSRRSRKHRDGDRDRDNEKEHRAASPPINAPTGPSGDNFSIRGASRPKAAKTMAPPPVQPPTGPRSLQPPKGPAADRDRDGRHSRKRSVSSIPSTPTEPAAPMDHYAAERERNARARDQLERGDRPDRSLSSRISTSQSLRPTVSSKRSRDDYETRDDDEVRPPLGPSASHGSKRRKSGEGDRGADIASVLTKGLRKKAGAPRRGGVKTEGDVERELERVERERDGRRW